MWPPVPHRSAGCENDQLNALALMLSVLGDLVDKGGDLLERHSSMVFHRRHLGAFGEQLIQVAAPLCRVHQR